MIFSTRSHCYQAYLTIAKIAAKAYAKLMAESGYTQPVKRKDIKVLGKQALGMFLVGTDAMNASNYISEHDQKIASLQIL